MRAPPRDLVRGGAQSRGAPATGRQVRTGRQRSCARNGIPRRPELRRRGRPLSQSANSGLHARARALNDPASDL